MITCVFMSLFCLRLTRAFLVIFAFVISQHYTYKVHGAIRMRQAQAHSLLLRCSRVDFPASPSLVQAYICVYDRVLCIQERVCGCLCVCFREHLCTPLTLHEINSHLNQKLQAKTSRSWAPSPMICVSCKARFTMDNIPRRALRVQVEQDPRKISVYLKVTA